MVGQISGLELLFWNSVAFLARRSGLLNLLLSSCLYIFVLLTFVMGLVADCGQRFSLVSFILSEMKEAINSDGMDHH